MMKQPVLRVSVTKADKKAARKATDQLIKTARAANKKYPKEVAVEGGWKLVFPMQDEAGKRIDGILLEYTEINGRKQFRYDPNLITVS